LGSVRAHWRLDVTSKGFVSITEPSRWLTSIPRMRILLPFSLLFCLTWCVPVGACSQPRSSDERPSGFVYAVRGEWNSSRTNKALDALDPVFAGDKIRKGKKSSADGFLGIALYDSTTQILRCQSKLKCDTYLVPSIQKQDEWLDRVIKSVRLFWPSATTARVPSAVRRSQVPQHAVVALASDGTVNFRMALSWMPSADYSAILIPLQESSMSLSERQVQFRVTPQFLGEQISGTTILAPGAYKLRLLSSSQEHLGEATVIVVPTSQFEMFNAAYNRLKKAITSGPVAPRPEETASFLAACLITFALDKSLVGSLQ
jgi:hypothetical protein